MNVRAILNNVLFSTEDKAKYPVREYTARPKKGVSLGVPTRVLFDVDVDEVQDRALSWCRWRLDDVCRDDMTREAKDAIVLAGAWEVRMSDLVANMKREGRRLEYKDMTLERLDAEAAKIAAARAAIVAAAAAANK